MSGNESVESDLKSVDAIEANVTDAKAKNVEEEADDDNVDYDPGVFTQENPVPPKASKRKSGSKGGSGKKKAKVGSGKKSAKDESTGNNMFNILCFK